MTMRAKQMPAGTMVRVRSARLVLTLRHGRKPWYSAGNRYRFSHAEVDASLEDGDAEVLPAGGDVAAV